MLNDFDFVLISYCLSCGDRLGFVACHLGLLSFLLGLFVFLNFFFFFFQFGFVCMVGYNVIPIELHLNFFEIMYFLALLFYIWIC